MRALLVTRSIPLHAGAGGMERVAWDLARTMSKDIELTVLTTTVPGQPVEFMSDGVQVITIRGSRPGRYSVRWWLKTGLFADAKNFGTIMSVSAGATAMVYLQPGPRYLFQAHGTALGELMSSLRVRPRLWPVKAARYIYWAFLDALTYRRVSTVIAASSQVEAGLRRWPYSGAWRNTDLRVISNAVDAEFFRYDAGRRREARAGFGFDDDCTVVATVSRLDRQKGVDRVIDAIKHCSPNVHLLIGGTGPEATNLRSHSNPKRTIFTGELNREGVRAALSAADVFVMPVRNFAREGLPVTLLEALASGLPVIVPMDSKWPDEIEPLLDFVDVADPDALGLAITTHGASATKRDNQLDGNYSLDSWAANYRNTFQ